MRTAQKSLLMTLWGEMDEEVEMETAVMEDGMTEELQEGAEATAGEDQPRTVVGMVEEGGLKVLWMWKWVREVADQERAVVREALTWTPRHTI